MAPTICCGVDEGRGHAQPLRTASSLAERLGRELVVVHVASSDPLAAGEPATSAGYLSPAPAPVAPYPQPIPDDRGELAERRDEARRRLERLVEACGVRDARLHVEVAPNVAEGLRNGAREHDAELLVVGSRGRGAARAALLGSTSHALAAEAPCPVVVVGCDD